MDICEGQTLHQLLRKLPKIKEEMEGRRTLVSECERFSIFGLTKYERNYFLWNCLFINACVCVGVFNVNWIKKRKNVRLWFMQILVSWQFFFTQRFELESWKSTERCGLLLQTFIQIFRSLATTVRELTI